MQKQCMNASRFFFYQSTCRKTHFFFWPKNFIGGLDSLELWLSSFYVKLQKLITEVTTRSFSSLHPISTDAHRRGSFSAKNVAPYLRSISVPDISFFALVFKKNGVI